MEPVDYHFKLKLGSFKGIGYLCSHVPLEERIEYQVGVQFSTGDILLFVGDSQNWLLKLKEDARVDEILQSHGVNTKGIRWSCEFGSWMVVETEEKEDSLFGPLGKCIEATTFLTAEWTEEDLNVKNEPIADVRLIYCRTPTEPVYHLLVAAYSGTKKGMIVIVEETGEISVGEGSGLRPVLYKRMKIDKMHELWLRILGEFKNL